MKIYHTETQEDYDALMVELEKQGCKWKGTENKPTHWNGWLSNGGEIGVRVDGNIITQGFLTAYKTYYKGTSIIKYKAKADEKMRFTKENVYKMVERYRSDFDYLIGDLKSDIFHLDDTPEKVVVPRCFDEWYRGIKAVCTDSDYAKRFSLWKICQEGFGHALEDENDNEISHDSELYKWIKKNKMLAIDAILNGYEFEKEQLWHVLDKHEHFMLRRYDDGVSTMRTSHTMKKQDHGHKDDFKLTKKEITDYDERYWTFAVPVD